MKLDSITLQNFKGIDNMEIKLDNKTTVIFGVNGVGKSTILQAIDLLYADIIAKLMGTVRSKDVYKRQISRSIMEEYIHIKLISMVTKNVTCQT